MSDGQLSQEEIDALLGHQSGTDKKKEQETAAKIDDLSETEEDVLGEIGNISFGSAATALSTILNQKVEITTPEVRLVDRNNLSEEFPVPHVSVLVNYTEGFQGSCMLVIQTEDASVIADLMMGGDGIHPTSDINEMEMSAVQEAMNQMMGSSSTALSTVFNRRIDISPPDLRLMDIKTHQGIEYIPEDGRMFEISFSLKIGSLVDSHIMQLVPIPFGKQLVSTLLSETGSVVNETMVKQTEKINPENRSEETAAATDQTSAIPSLQEPEPRKAQENSGVSFESNGSNERSNHAANHKDVQPVEFSDFGQEPPLSGKPVPRNLELLMDIPLDVSVELGHTQKTVKEVLELGPGSIIELDKLAGEPIDILVNQKYVAKGEVVVVDENFGIRITEIQNHLDRIKDL
ncbi:flagellar motor switch phosphatase FliY [Sporolactobacillus putidus]|uniref:Flagellar motor switch phosphatase FliY n=1 Tax=Sporolactobacillus putidus TaxID=492735 RepID=A0A917VZT9_9BACL|nr:flagellar motor switch phosphatase FliY [Sporolactobacillus putidus]GGL44045.1 flagellar motor switch phosphatase FliY [Sporolactobacillus putidus]